MGGEDTAHSNLLGLAKTFPVFPSPDGCRTQGAKVDFVGTLDSIASKMRTSRPESRPLEGLPPCGWVLKREFSDGDRHVYIPGYPVEAKGEDRETKRALRFLAGVEPDKTSNCRWLAQEYVPELRRVGEIRHMCVDGIPIRAVLTGRHPDGHRSAGERWSIEDIRNMTYLEDIRFVLHGVLTLACRLTKPTQLARERWNRDRRGGCVPKQ